MFVYSLKRWAALASYLDDGDLPIDNNWVENQIWPIATGRLNQAARLNCTGSQCGCSYACLIGTDNDSCCHFVPFRAL